jgi:hypothetical protein
VRIQQLQMDPMLSARIIRESSVTCRDLRRRLAELEASSRVTAGLLADSNQELALARASRDRLAEQLAVVKADRDHLEAQVRSERIRAQSDKRDAEKIQKQAAAERQSILDVLNDLVIEHAALRQTEDREAQEAREAAEAIRRSEHVIGDYQRQLSDVTAALKDVRESISFRVGSTAGRPFVALLRMLRSLVSSGGKTN